MSAPGSGRDCWCCSASRATTPTRTSSTSPENSCGCVSSTRKGNRPSYIKAAPEAVSCPLYERFTARVAELLGRGVATGEFGADMQVELVNDGPVTIWMDSKNKE